MPSDGYEEGIFFSIPIIRDFLAMNMDQGFPVTFFFFFVKSTFAVFS